MSTRLKIDNLAYAEGTETAQRVNAIAESIESGASTVGLFQDIIHALMSEDQDLEVTIGYCLQRLCEAHGWSVGHAVLRRGDASESAWARHTWHFTDPERQEPLMQATLDAQYENSLWMPDVLDTEGVRVIPDVEAEPAFKRTEAVRDAGLRSMVILPINVGGQVPAYMEFFSEEMVEPGPAMLDVMSCVAALMGQLIQRRIMDKAVTNSIWLMQQRVGRELHDNVCQDLVGLAYLGRELASSLTAEGHSHAEVARAMVSDIDVCLDRARAISKGLCPFDCEAGELCRALGDLIDGSRRRFKMAFSLSCPDTLELANNELAQQLYYIAHEALTNVVKHSDAKHVHIDLKVERGLLRLRIEDDGVGMLRNQDASSGIGIRAMRHRADTIGAKLDIESDTNRGTVLTCTLPI